MFFMRWLGAWFVGMTGTIFLRLSAQAFHPIGSDYFVSTSFTIWALIVFAGFFAIGYSIIGIGQAAVKRIEYYEQTLRFQRAYPQGRLATGNYDGAEQL